MIESVLVANRGEIARRVIRTARRLGVRTIAVYSDADVTLPFVMEADEAHRLGPEPPAESYLNIGRVLDVAQESGAAAVHPGYGFRSEDPGFAQAVEQAGLVWVGPPVAAIAAMADKISARSLAQSLGVPVSSGSERAIENADDAVEVANKIGYPVMVKAAGGGGGLGMAAVHDEASLRSKVESISGFAGAMFGNPGVFVERFHPAARHIEVQVLGLADGSVVAVGDRNCSVQRRNQKLVEECPAPGLSRRTRAALFEAAVAVARGVGYRNAGTVEFLVHGPPDDERFVFLEMNTRLQVEHTVTEETFGIDLVEEQLRIASGLAPSARFAERRLEGHAIEFRINAEDPVRFLPGPGEIVEWTEPVGAGIRVDAGYSVHDTVPRSYDSLVAKLVVHAGTRDDALRRAGEALAGCRLTGPKSNLPFHVALLRDPAFCAGTYTTAVVEQVLERGRRLAEA